MDEVKVLRAVISCQFFILGFFANQFITNPSIWQASKIAITLVVIIYGLSVVRRKVRSRNKAFDIFNTLAGNKEGI